MLQTALFCYNSCYKNPRFHVVCKGRSKTVARGGRSDFVALLVEASVDFELDGGFGSRLREAIGSVYRHAGMDRRSTCGVG